MSEKRNHSARKSEKEEEQRISK